MSNNINIFIEYFNIINDIKYYQENYYNYYLYLLIIEAFSHIVHLVEYYIHYLFALVNYSQFLHLYLCYYFPSEIVFINLKPFFHLDLYQLMVSYYFVIQIPSFEISIILSLANFSAKSLSNFLRFSKSE